MNNDTIELGFYCEACGNELETEFKMDAKRYNRARVDVTPCRICERNRTVGTVGATKHKTEYLPTENLPISKKRRGRKQKAQSKDPSDARPKRRGRPPKKRVEGSAPEIALLSTPAKKRRGRPPKNPVPGGGCDQLTVKGMPEVPVRRRGRPRKNPLPI